MYKTLLAILIVAGWVLSACSGTAAPSGSGFGTGGGSPSSSSPAKPSSSTSASGIQSGVLTAGDIDDNLNFLAFQHYLSSMFQSDSSQVLPNVSLAGRVTVKILDTQGQGVANARVSLFTGASTSPALEASAGADGVFHFFPHYDGLGDANQFTVQVRLPETDTPTAASAFNLNDLGEERTVELRWDGVVATRPSALDLMFVIDTTGSMGDEINYLQAELRDIIAAVRSQFPEVSMRFGLVVYRDLGDAYVVRSFDFTDSVETMQHQLEQQSANGGGDYPEAMEQALGQALQADWRSGNTARLLFLVADAPPHDENLGVLLDEAKTARQLGLRIYPLAASGVADTAEYLMRVMAATTQGRYLFLTDDSGVGNEHAEPKVPCYVVTRLDQLLIRVMTSELSGLRVEAAETQVLRIVGHQEGGVCLGK